MAPFDLGDFEQIESLVGQSKILILFELTESTNYPSFNYY